MKGKKKMIIIYDHLNLGIVFLSNLICDNLTVKNPESVHGRHREPTYGNVTRWGISIWFPTYFKSKKGITNQSIM